MPEQKLYWVFCDWLSKNIPETILNMLGIKSMTSELEIDKEYFEAVKKRIEKETRQLEFDFEIE